MVCSWQTDIWLVVRVPVLSEQMTVVQPRVSTEGSFLQHTMQWITRFVAASMLACEHALHPARPIY